MKSSTRAASATVISRFLIFSIIFSSALIFAQPCRTASNTKSAGNELESLLPQSEYKRGDTVLPITFKSIDGKTIDLKNFLGKKVIVLAFWLDTCDACVAKIDDLKQVIAKNNMEKDVQVFTIARGASPEEREDMKAMFANANIKYPIVLDPDMAIKSLFNITMVPSFLIISRDSILVTQPVFNIYKPLRDLNFEDMLTRTVRGEEIPPIQFRERDHNSVLKSMIGKAPPDFTLKDVYGDMYPLKDFLNGTPLLIIFWHPNCKPCEKDMPYLHKHLLEIAGKYRFKVLSIAYLTSETHIQMARDYLDANGHDFPVLIDSDGAVGEAYHITDIPWIYIIGRDGRTAEIITALRGSLDALLDPVLKSLQ